MNPPSKGGRRRMIEGQPYVYGRWITDAGNPIPLKHSGTPKQREAMALTSNLLRRLTEQR